MNIKSITFAGMALAISASAAMGAAHSAKAIHAMDSSKGKILTNAKGMTLYTFDKDKAGVSNCVAACQIKWPPVKAKVAGMKSGAFAVIKRKSGKLQWAHNGQPLYTWIKDKKPGDVTGDGVKGVWHVARP